MVDAPARTEEITCKLGSLRSGCAPADSGITVSWPEVQSERRDVSDGSKCEELAQGTHFRVAPNYKLVLPTGNALRFPSAAKPLRAAFGPIAFGFWKKIADGRIAIAHRGPRDTVI